MTLERAKWWDCLPTEEKRVRSDIDEFKRAIKYHKKHLIPYIAYAKYRIRYNKKAIKALRKQIAMRPFVMRTEIGDFEKCPTCKVRTIRYFPHCACCGQKLRWE